MRIYLFLIASLLFLTSPVTAAAAVLSAVPSRTSVEVGDTVSVSVYVNSEGVAINNAEGSLTFPREIFDVISVSKDTSLFSLWIEAPAYDGNSTVSFNGGLPSPGYQGSNGKLFTVTFRAKAAGSAPLALLNGAVRANDGLGTDVLRAVVNGSVAVNEAQVVSQPKTPTTPAATPSNTPSLGTSGTLKLSSQTHPDQTAWYRDPSPKLSWELPGGTDSVQTIVSANKSAAPLVTYKPAVSEKTLDPLEDGVWYFNIRAHTTTGWGKPVSYTLQIDSAAPTLASSLSFDATSSALFIQSTAQDELSGVDHYEILLNKEVYQKVSSSEISNGFMRVPLNISPGAYTVEWVAVDRAGNRAVSEPISIAAVETPTLSGMLWSKVLTFDYRKLLLPATLLISLMSLMLNLILWNKLRHIHRIVSPSREGRTEVRRRKRE